MLNFCFINFSIFIFRSAFLDFLQKVFITFKFYLDQLGTSEIRITDKSKHPTLGVSKIATVEIFCQIYLQSFIVFQIEHFEQIYTS